MPAMVYVAPWQMGWPAEVWNGTMAYFFTVVALCIATSVGQCMKVVKKDNARCGVRPRFIWHEVCSHAGLFFAAPVHATT